MSEKKKRKPYKRKTGALPDLTFEVETSEGDVFITARHVKYHEISGLDAAQIGELPEGADPTGKKYLRDRIFKLGRVTVDVDTGDSGDPDVAAARASGDWAKFYWLEGNENLAWLGWAKYLEALDGLTPKSGDESRSDGDGESGGEAEPDGAALASLSAM